MMNYYIPNHVTPSYLFYCVLLVGWAVRGFHGSNTVVLPQLFRSGLLIPRHYLPNLFRGFKQVLHTFLGIPSSSLVVELQGVEVEHASTSHISLHYLSLFYYLQQFKRGASSEQTDQTYFQLVYS